MNIIDKNFYELINLLNQMDIGEIFENIKSNYMKVHPDTRASIEKFVNDFKYWGTLNSSNNDFNLIYEKSLSFYEHLEDYIWLYKNLKDYRSKKLLYGILNNWYRYDFTTVKECYDNTFKHYFDLNLIPSCNNVTLVDLGAYTGDTIEDFINIYGENSYNKIYAYDITKNSIAKMKNNLAKYNNIIYKNIAISDKEETLYINESIIDASANIVNNEGNIEIKATTLDNDIKEKIDIIKMDIEGYEQKAINGSINHIKNDNPILLISVYHNNEDLWKIPKMIYELNNNYDFYLNCHGGNIFPTEIVLVCIPKKSDSN